MPDTNHTSHEKYIKTISLALSISGLSNIISQRAMDKINKILHLRISVEYKN